MCGGFLDINKSRTILEVIQDYLNKVMVPSLSSNQKWGNLSQQHISEFFAVLQSFSLFLNSNIINIHYNNTCIFVHTTGAQKSINDAVHLSMDTVIDLDTLKTSEGCISASKNPETVAGLEQLIGLWCQQVEDVLAQGSQIRKEADDTGNTLETKDNNNYYSLL